MNISNVTRVVMIGLLGLLVAGCATGYHEVVIPHGEWSGHGTCLLKQWPGENNDPPELFLFQSYETSLTIQPAPEEGAIRLEVLTLRGEMPPLDGDRTHLVVDLTECDRAADDTAATYQVTNFGISMEDKPLDHHSDPKEPVSASCQVLDGELILRINYMEGFVDIFRFHGDRLYKDGSFFPEDGQGLVHWSEVLKRQ
ncbi:MAG: hypothetical protein ABIG44_00180 [Planctomycetota bacterium]